MLQWSRNFIVAEIRVSRFPMSLTVAASMEPQLYRCGNHRARPEPGAVSAQASMEPQLYRCGNPDTGGRDRRRYRASMEPQLYRCGNGGCPPGRGPPWDRFNGAATLSLRKFAVGVLVPGALHASMEPQLYRCGNLIQTAGVYVHIPCFNGAATLSLRKSYVAQDIAYPHTWLQWSRNFIVAEILRPTPRPYQGP